MPRISEKPAIPDHEVLRKIGVGAYGEVWLARSVTGTYRAVKVVWREDFEDERSFEREFEGILSYEPVSRGHPGLVHVLHVGRKIETPFYYYVMELGDDAHNGKEINSVEYSPRTLRSDLKQAEGKALPTDFVIDVGIRLSDALGYLHDRGLVHRDVKPANIIFIAGQAKFADIGLVAPRDQRTFVGTEGFVPPEGPGSSAADIYSLGKVLYEIGTGLDRMNFPELPSAIPPGTALSHWQALNEVICQTCEYEAKRRKINTARQLTAALTSILAGKPHRHRFAKSAVKLIVGAIAAALIMGGGFFLLSQKNRGKIPVLAAATEPEKPGDIVISSIPSGAQIFDQDGNFLGETPLGPISKSAGTTVEFTLKLNGFRDWREKAVVVSGQRVGIGGELKVFAPPLRDEPWTDVFSSLYLPEESRHALSGFLPAEAYRKYCSAQKKPEDLPIVQVSYLGREQEVVLVREKAVADQIAAWLTTFNISAGLLTEESLVVAHIAAEHDCPGLPAELLEKGLRPVKLYIEPVRFSSAKIESEPNHASVWMNSKLLGETPMSTDRIKPGPYEIVVKKPGFAPFIFKGETSKEPPLIKLSAKLVPDGSVDFVQSWENSLGMKLVPIDSKLMACAWETRIRDFSKFLEIHGKALDRSPENIVTLPEHPVTNVSREDAIAFCNWLTTKERKEGKIEVTDFYRLPTDKEWSAFAEIFDEKEGEPFDLDDFGAGSSFPWGTIWPPEDMPEKPANLADQTAARSILPQEKTLQNYDDGFPTTSPVGSFSANRLGIFDLAGNVQEWVQNNYGGRNFKFSDYGVLRGGSWRSYQKSSLTARLRTIAPPEHRDSTYGFRVVLARKEK